MKGYKLIIAKLLIHFTNLIKGTLLPILYVIPTQDIDIPTQEIEDFFQSIIDKSHNFMLHHY